jgi:hypothetical protein
VRVGDWLNSCGNDALAHWMLDACRTWVGPDSCSFARIALDELALSRQTGFDTAGPSGCTCPTCQVLDAVTASAAGHDLPEAFIAAVFELARTSAVWDMLEGSDPRVWRRLLPYAFPDAHATVIDVAVKLAADWHRSVDELVETATAVAAR